MNAHRGRFDFNRMRWLFDLNAGLSFLYLLCFLSTQLYAQKYIIAVMPLKDDTRYQWFEKKYSDYANWLGTAVSAAINHLNIVPVVNRSQVDNALYEFKLYNAGLISDATAAKVGRWLGANTIVMGTVYKIEEIFRIDAYSIDAESGKMNASISPIMCSKESLPKVPEIIARSLLSQLLRKGVIFDETFSLNVQEEYENAFPVCVITDLRLRFSIHGELIKSHQGLFNGYRIKGIKLFFPQKQCLTIDPMSPAGGTVKIRTRDDQYAYEFQISLLENRPYLNNSGMTELALIKFRIKVKKYPL